MRLLLSGPGLARLRGQFTSQRSSAVGLCPCRRWAASSSSGSDSSKKKTISIGKVTKDIRPPTNPELVPVNFLPKDSEIPPETKKHLQWMMQKDLLGQDMFLIGCPSPLRRSLAMQYLELTERESEYVALSRDTTESDLKQRREIVRGTAHYVDQSAVRAAAKGRVLVLEGIEKAERNVLPVLNNLLENREMHLEDGRLLIPASRYDKLLEEHGQEELDHWKLVRVSEDFRVIALGLPVPRYVGNPLDPPLRSRFQARDIRHLPFKEQLEVLERLGPNVPKAGITQILSFAHTLLTEESSNLGLPDFPVENLPPLIEMLNVAPTMSLYEAVTLLYPYNTFLPEEGIKSVEETLKTFNITQGEGQQPLEVEETRFMSGHDKATVSIKLDGSRKPITTTVLSGPHPKEECSDFVPVAYHNLFLANLMLSHAVKDFCVIGPRGCGKSAVVQQLADLLGYETEPIMLYQDMTARDLLQQRATLPNGDTVWRHSPLVTAAIEGKMAILDGIHRIHRGTLAVLHRLVHDKELQLYDGTRLLGQDRYDAVKTRDGLNDEQMKEAGILQISPSFRIAALAEPPVVGGSAKEQWLTPEILSMFFFHTMRPLSEAEERRVLTKLTGKLPDMMEEVLKLTHRLRSSGDTSIKSIANSLSTRQLLRISRRLKKFPDENAHNAVKKACLARFLPSLPRESLDKMMEEENIEIPAVKDVKGIEAVCKIDGGHLTLGETSAPLYSTDVHTKVPETLFYDTYQNVASMEAMLQDFLVGEHLLLVGNQGVGKNKLIDRLLSLLRRPREYIQLHRDTTVQSLTLSPTVKDGLIVYEDSPLVRAVKSGHILVVDEADKAPTQVTCILKTLVESGEMILSDGRRIVAPLAKFDRLKDREDLIRMHPDFRMVVLANRPGFPFLGNDFFGAMGDLFACHAIDNPSLEAEMSMLKQYGPNVPEDQLRRLVRCFSELRAMADDGQIQYPYSTREAVNVVKHLQRFPTDGLGSVVRNVFDFDSYDKETRDTVDEVLHKHGIPIHTSPRNVGLAREFPLSDRRLLGHWQIKRDSTIDLIPVSSRTEALSDPQEVSVQRGPLDRVEARGVGFSEMQSYYQLPFYETSVAGDVCVRRDAHNRQFYDTVHVCSSNPAWLFSMKPSGEEYTKMPINHCFDTRRQGVIPRMKMASMGGNFEGSVAIHDEVSNSFILVHPESGSIVNLEVNKMMETMKESYMSVKAAAQGNQRRPPPFYRMLTDLAMDNRFVFYTPNGGNLVQLLDLSSDPSSHTLELPVPIKSLHVLNEDQYLLVSQEETPGKAKNLRNLYLLHRDRDSEGNTSALIPSQLRRIQQDTGISDVVKVAKEGLSDFGLRMTLGDNMSVPNTLMVTKDSYATLALGFPAMEFSENEIHSWMKDKDAIQAENMVQPSQVGYYSGGRYIDPSRNYVFLNKSCQVVRPVPAKSVAPEIVRDNHGLSSPGSISAFLEVTDLMAGRLRYVPVPDPASISVYSAWYKQTYPDQTLSLCEMSNEGLASVDNGGVVRLWETGVANLERSLEDWRRMLGESAQQLTIERDKVKDPDTPKHGKIDPDNMPHVGGNQWAGGTGGRDTAGLGGLGGPYRLDAGHSVHQVPEVAKDQVPEHIRRAAREMNRKAFQERLREIRMSEHDADLYDRYASQVRKQVQALKTIISGLQAKAKDRQWQKNQTSGELDDTRLIEGITGEKSIYKKRAEQEPEPGAPQEKPKRLRLLVDVSGSMYRFNGHDQRLERSMEAMIMVMEALEGYTDKIKFDIIGHSGEESAIPFVTASKGAPRNEKERLDVLRMMHAHSQFCMSGDHTLPATVTAIADLAKMVDEHDESLVVVLSDANFDRYGISPKAFSKILNKNDQVSAFAIFIGSLGDQADQLAKRLPSGKAFVCLDTKKIPEILKTIFTSTMLK